MGIKKPNNPAILYFMPSEIVPLKGMMLEFKIHGLFDRPVAYTQLFPNMQLELIQPVQVSDGMAMLP
jgi:hypothetical protein